MRTKKPIDYGIEIDVEQNTDNTLRALVVTLSVGGRWSVAVRRCWFQQGVIRLEMTTRADVWAFVPNEALVVARVLGAAHILSEHINKTPYDFVGCDPAVVLETLLPQGMVKPERGLYFYAVVFPVDGMLDNRDGEVAVHRFADPVKRDLFVAVRPYHRRKAGSSDPFVKRANRDAAKDGVAWESRQLV